MHAVDEGKALFLKRLGGCDVRLDHEFFDQPMRFQTLGRHHAIDLAFRVEENFAFRQIKVERAALVARFRNGPVGLPQRF